MDSISIEEFIAAAKEFVEISNKLWDGWKFNENNDLFKSYLKKECFINPTKDDSLVMKAEYVIFYSMSYGVPQFSFNVWNSSGVLLTLEQLRQISFIIEPAQSKENLYSIITQQEHPIFFRPYFIVHPCRTGELLACFKGDSANILVTFLGLPQWFLLRDKCLHVLQIFVPDTQYTGVRTMYVSGGCYLLFTRIHNCIGFIPLISYVHNIQYKMNLALLTIPCSYLKLD